MSGVERKIEGVIIDGDSLRTVAGATTQTSIISKSDMITAINDADWKIQEQRQKVRTAQEIVDDELAEMPAYKEFVEAEKKFEMAKESLRIACLSNGDLNNYKEDLAVEKRELETRKAVLSGLLVRYAADYRLKNVEVDQENHTIVLTGKIGKKINIKQELPL